MAIKDNSPKITFNLISLLAIVVLIFLVGLGANFLGKYNNDQKNQKVETAIAGTQTVAYDGIDGKTALDLLREKADIKTEDSSIGVFVTSINGTENTDSNYWLFYVDGQLAPIAADQYQTKPGEKIEWRYEDINSLPLP